MANKYEAMFNLTSNQGKAFKLSEIPFTSIRLANHEKPNNVLFNGQDKSNGESTDGDN